MKIKIVFVTDNLAVGGVSSVLIGLCNNLDKTIYEVHLIILSSDNNEMEKNLPLNTHITRYYFNYKYDKRYDLISYLLNSIFLNRTKNKSIKILRLIDNLKPDILHFHTLPRQLAMGIIARKENNKLKLVFTDHSKRIGDQEYRFHQRILLSFAYRLLYKKYNIIAVSSSVESYIKKHNLFNNKKLFKTLENSIDLKNYHTNSKINNSINCIYISRLNPHKGIDTLIKAWQLCKKELNTKLFIIGPDETGGEIIKLAEGDPSIVFTGAISNVKTYLSESTIGIFPSQKEGLPIALLEMMAFNLPIIVSNIPELTSIVRNEVEGLHFKLDDSIDLKDKIEQLLSDDNLVKQLGINSRKRVEEICTNNEPISFHKKFYSQLLNHN
jgi:glycosyltransferase involved in cell wall biosynthesis